MICDEYGIIKEVSDELLSVLVYERNELIDKFMGIIMSPFLSFLHKTYLLPMYRKMNHEEKMLVVIFWYS